MTKKEFIKKFELRKTTTKAVFYDGMQLKSRIAYINKYEDLYVFYNNDLHSIEPYKSNPYVEGMEEMQCRMGAAYSWYH